MIFDVLIIGDFRFPGGTSTSIASEVKALSNAGYSVGMIATEGSVLRFPHPVHKTISDIIHDGHATLIRQDQYVETKLCTLHHPQAFDSYPLRPWNVRADQTLLVVHHPPTNAHGVASYDWNKISSIVTGMFGQVSWAPVGPKVRDSFRGLKDCPPLTGSDWHNILDVDVWKLAREGFLGARPVIGRHSRPDPLKWPDDRKTFLHAYPDDPDMPVRFMGYSSEQDLIIGKRPKNWEILSFGALPVKSFLGSIDFFVYFHSAEWTEAFGRSILEAIATGAVAVLPKDFEPLFGDAAVYCNPADVHSLVFNLHRSPQKFLHQSARGTAFARERFGPAEAVARVKKLIGHPGKSKQPISASPAGKSKIMWFTSNGVGMGHLTRALAVARRLPESVEPMVISMSKAFSVCAIDGVHAEYLPYHRSVGFDHDRWDESIEHEMKEILAFHNPDVFIFDGNVPYFGLMRAVGSFPKLWKVWQRRAMWAPESGDMHIAQEPLFDVVIEPGEIAGALDRGQTKENRSKTIDVSPISYLRDGESLSKAQARKALDLPADGIAVLVQLGSGNNFDLSHIRRQIVTRLGVEANLTLVNVDWLIGNRAGNLPDGVRRLSLFPVAKYLAAFDFAISTAGYNTFHENLMAALPTVFVPNRNPEQDEQWLRAQYAEVHGMALTALSDDPHNLDTALTMMLDAASRARMCMACSRVQKENGADQTAQYLSELSMIRRRWP